MRRFISRQVPAIITVLLGISFLSFLLTYLAPGDPVRAMFAVSGSIPDEAVLNQVREELGLNRPFIIQYISWLGNCLRGDFGTSLAHGEPVAKLLAVRVWPTLQLAFLSLVIMLAAAVPMGLLSALSHYRGHHIGDHIIRVITFIQISVPNFWVGMLLLYVVALKWRLLPVVTTQMGMQKMLLPAVTLAFAMTGKYARQIRAFVLDELGQSYVSGARARGLKEYQIIWFHVIPNTMLPMITLLGLSLGSLLGGTAVVEVIFSYPGLGSLALAAITAMDYPLIQGFVLWIALIYMGVNLFVDLSYRVLDPRLKKGVQ